MFVGSNPTTRTIYVSMMELVYMLDLKSNASLIEGSNPSTDTSLFSKDTYSNLIENNSS